MKWNFKRSGSNLYTSAFTRFAKPHLKPFVVTVLIFLALFLLTLYLYHPPFNFHSPAFMYYIFIFFIGALVILTALNICALIKEKTYRLGTKLWGYAVGLVIMIIAASVLLTSRFLNAREYASRIEVSDSSFDFVPEVDFTKTPIIDRDSTLALGDRVMGQMPDLVSQFEVATDYTQISYKDSVYRVTPLEYADIFKYFTNRDEGIPAYITVNSTTGEAELVRLNDLGLEGMRYVPSALFNENLMRKLQMDYPTKIFGSPSFEIDEEGHPWYICTTYTYKAMGTKKMVEGVVLFNPINGDSTYYDDPLKVPSWVDRIYPESLVMEEFDDYGSLRGGFINSIFGQKDVFVTSEGYNYLESGGDIWIYSGITSANSDAANLGFVLINLRTHETHMITSAGANEVSAMSSAEGSVRNYGYRATFPLLVNVNDMPVYLMSLKDDAGLTKMYAMVDATDYQIVETATIDEGLDILKQRFSGDTAEIIPPSSLEEKTITLANVRILNLEGTSIVYFTDTEGNRYRLDINEQNIDRAAFLSDGQLVTILYLEGDINFVSDISY